jgi:hypothetical protein
LRVIFERRRGDECVGRLEAIFSADLPASSAIARSTAISRCGWSRALTTPSSVARPAEPASTLPPFAARWHLEVRKRPEGPIEHGLVIGWLGLVEIRVDRVADDGRERLVLASAASVEGLALPARRPFVRTVLA